MALALSYENTSTVVDSIFRQKRELLVNETDS